MLRRSWLWCGVAALVLSLNAVTQAQSASPGAAPATETDPNDPLEIGKAAFDAGRLEQALRAFETSYQQTKKPRTLFRVGDTADKLGQHARAITAFQEYLRLVPSSKDRPFVESRIRANEAAAAGSGEATSQPTAATPASTAPSQVAQAVEPGPVSAPAAATEPDAHESAAGPLWIWVGAGVLSVAAIVVAGVLIGSSSSSSTPAPVRGNVGGTVQTLGAP